MQVDAFIVIPAKLRGCDAVADEDRFGIEVVLRMLRKSRADEVFAHSQRSLAVVPGDS